MSSADDSDQDESGTGSLLRVKKVKKKYRDSFHPIDKAYYSSHKQSKDKDGYSNRQQPPILDLRDSEPLSDEITNNSHIQTLL